MARYWKRRKVCEVFSSNFACVHAGCPTGPSNAYFFKPRIAIGLQPRTQAQGENRAGERARSIKQQALLFNFSKWLLLISHFTVRSLHVQAM